MANTQLFGGKIKTAGFCLRIQFFLKTTPNSGNLHFGYFALKLGIDAIFIKFGSKILKKCNLKIYQMSHMNNHNII